jgi:hypothetical protein
MQQVLLLDRGAYRCSLGRFGARCLSEFEVFLYKIRSVRLYYTGLQTDRQPYFDDSLHAICVDTV